MTFDPTYPPALNATADVLTEEVQGVVCLRCNVVNVLVPSEVAGNCDSKAFSLIYMLELMTMEDVWKVDDISLTSGVDDLTLFQVELHHSSLLPFSTGVQTLLEQLGISFSSDFQADHSIISKEPSS